MRRKEGQLTPIEVALLRAAVELHGKGEPEFHGWQLARARQQAERLSQPMALGSLYRGLERLHDFGYLDSRLEDPAAAEAERRPRRRFYRVTAEGRRALARADAPATAPVRLAPQGA